MMGNGVQAQGIAGKAPAGVFKLVWGLAATGLSVLGTAVLGPLAALAAMAGRIDILSTISRVWARLIIGVCGVRVEIEGLENLAGLDSCVLVSNHQSFFDIFAAIAFIPREVRFVAKRELLRIPAIGYALGNSEHIVIDRQAGGPTIRKALNVIALRRLIFVFAEGHRFSDNCVHEFNDGAAWLAIKTGVPCVPVAFSGTAAFFPRGAKVVVPGGRMRMALGKPIAVAELKVSDRSTLTRQLEEAVRMLFVAQV